MTVRSHGVRALTAVLLLLAPLLHAQEPNPPDTKREPVPTARVRDREYTTGALLALFEGTPGGEYTLGAGDEVTIEAWGRPELSGKHTIGPDGVVTLPLVGSIRMADLTREEASSAAADAWAPFYKQLAVNVRVDRYASNRVFILGRVASPGVLMFDTPPTLLEALTRAGALPIGGIGADKATLTRCAVFRGRDRVVWIELRRLFSSGETALNIRLQRNDIIYVPDTDDQLVYVLGEVQKPGAYRLSPDMSFMDLLMQAGGPTRDASDDLYLIRSSGQKEWRFSMKEHLKGSANLATPLEEYDTIYVGRKGLARFGYVFEKLAPFNSLILLGAAVRP